MHGYGNKHSSIRAQCRGLKFHELIKNKMVYVIIFMKHKVKIPQLFPAIQY